MGEGLVAWVRPRRRFCGMGQTWKKWLGQAWLAWEEWLGQAWEESA